MRPERDNRRGLTFAAALLACGLLTALHSRAAQRGHADLVTGTVRDMGLVPGETGTALAGPLVASERRLPCCPARVWPARMPTSRRVPWR